MVAAITLGLEGRLGAFDIASSVLSPTAFSWSIRYDGYRDRSDRLLSLGIVLHAAPGTVIFTIAVRVRPVRAPAITYAVLPVRSATEERGSRTGPNQSRPWAALREPKHRPSWS
jgi:hypothetical protein